MVENMLCPSETLPDGNDKHCAASCRRKAPAFRTATPQLYSEPVDSHAEHARNSLAINHESTCAIANILAHATDIR